MYKGATFAAIIPARGGSKRLPHKNILDLEGKPLISWTIEAALKSRYIDEIVVTSDDDEIIHIAQKAGVKTLKRPDELARDDTSTVDTVLHALNHMKRFDYVVLLQPTSPLRTDKHIDEAIELCSAKEADAVISVCETEHSPLWSNVLPKDGDMSCFLREEVKNKRSQELPAHYRLNGALYICRTEKLSDQRTFFLNTNTYAYIMDRESSVDIDEAFDFLLAKTLLSCANDQKPQ